MSLAQSDVSASSSTPDRGNLEQVSLDVRVARLPGLQVEIDLEARLVLVGVRDLDEDGSVAIGVGLAFGAPQELE